MRDDAQPDGRPLGESEHRSCFFAVCGPKYTELSVCAGSRFPVDDVLLRSEDIRDQVAKLCEVAQKF